MKQFIGIAALILALCLGFVVGDHILDTAYAAAMGNRGEDVDRAIVQVQDIHNELAPMPWTYELPVTPGWYRWVNPYQPEYPEIYPVKEGVDGELHLVLGAQWIPLKDIEGLYMWSSGVSTFPPPPQIPK